MSRMRKGLDGKFELVHMVELTTDELHSIQVARGMEAPSFMAGLDFNRCLDSRNVISLREQAEFNAHWADVLRRAASKLSSEAAREEALAGHFQVVTLLSGY